MVHFRTYVKICDMRTRDGVIIALRVLGIAGLTGLVVAAPNATKALELLLKKSPAKEFPSEKILKELKRHGLVHVSKHGDDVSLHLTPAGAYRLQEILIEDIEISTPNKWDKKWRLVSFDIPVKFSAQRQKLTQQLQKQGFFMIQRSLWAYPFPCFDELEQLTGHYNLLRYCSFMEISKFDNATVRKLVRHFEDILNF